MHDNSACWGDGGTGIWRTEAQEGMKTSKKIDMEKGHLGERKKMKKKKAENQ